MSSTIPTEPVAFILQVKITIDPANRAAFLQHFKPVYDVVVAEPECAYFVMGENMQEPGVFRWTEGWKKDAAWFMSVQMKKDYYKSYLEATELMFIQPREFGGFSPVEGTGHVKVEFPKV